MILGDDYMSNMTSPGSGNLELMQRIEALENENKQLKGIILWENPNPDEAFSEQDIILGSADYTKYDIYFKTTNQMFCQSVYKGFNTILSTTDGNGINAHIRARYRFVEFVNDTTLRISDAYNAVYNGTNEQNVLLVPYKSIGFK